MYTALCGIALLKVMSDFLILKGRNYIEITNSKIRVSQSFKNKGAEGLILDRRNWKSKTPEARRAWQVGGKEILCLERRKQRRGKAWDNKRMERWLKQNT